MNKKLLVFGLLILGMVVSSCTTTYIIGKDFNDNEVNKIKIGETNKSQIVQLFGEPFKKGKINQFDVFIYTYEENVFPFGSDVITVVWINKRYKTLFILFDEKNIVDHFTYNIPITASSLELLMIKEEIKKQQQRNNNTNNLNK